MPTWCTFLPPQSSACHPLGDHRRSLDFAAVAAHLDHLAVADALLLGQVLADLDERRGLVIAFDSMFLVQKWKCSVRR
jgi:predicted nucleic acid-binding Zn ribbon protein